MQWHRGCTRSACSPRVAKLASGLFLGLTGFSGVSAFSGLTGCQRKSSAAGETAPAVVEVGVLTLQPRATVLTTELPGRTSAYEASEVRPQVSGIIRARLFTEGQMVEKGQTLYQIDARLYRAAANQARANLESAEAASVAARSRAERYAVLAEEQVVSELELTDSRAAAAQAAAAVQQARAALDTAMINLRFTEVPAPIDGRIGRSLVTTGALVTAAQAEPLATIQRLDPIFVDLQESSAELLALRRSLARGGMLPASADVELKLEDGSDYGRTGSLEFAEAMVDPSTGSVTLRARFDNPDGILLPGMYVRAVINQGEQPSAILAPQRGVLRDPKGEAMALLVGPDDKVLAREIVTTRAIGDDWLVDEGLAAGDRLIVEGTNKVRPGQTVKPVAVTTPSATEQAPETPPGGAGGG
jgi:membrane fusion protein (multidrug efflux system)